jgi:hypothetical protein
MYKVFLPLNLKSLQHLAAQRPELFGQNAAAFTTGGFVDRMVDMAVRLARIEHGIVINERDHELILDFNYDPRDTSPECGRTPRYGYSLRSVVIARRDRRCPESLVDVVYHPEVSREWVAYWTYKKGSEWINYRELLTPAAEPKINCPYRTRRRLPRWDRISLPLVEDDFFVTMETTSWRPDRITSPRSEMAKGDNKTIQALRDSA